MNEQKKVTVKVNAIIKGFDKKVLSERMSSRMVKCASVLPDGEFIGWQMNIPTKGKIDISLFGSESLSVDDLRWIVEKTGKVSVNKKRPQDNKELHLLYEFYLPVAESTPKPVGFISESNTSETGSIKWPTAFSGLFAEIIEAFRQSGAQFKAIIGPATNAEQELCRRNTLRSINVGRIDIDSYIGNPIKARFLLCLPSEPSIRLRSVIDEAIPGIRMRCLGDMNEETISQIWNNPLKEAMTLPDYAVRVMLMEPELVKAIVGIEVYEEEMKRIPATHKNTKTEGAVTIGKATDVTGVKRNINISQIDLRRHYQIVGQTGTGKSTLLTSVILSAIKQGHGLTFFDPHGTTIDTIIRCVPEQYAHRIRVVRIGDVENPVPLNIWDSGDPLKEERNISDLVELFSDIFDPRREGFVGPRYERWLSTFAKASLAFLGRHASLESIAVISQNKDNMLKVAKAIVNDYPELCETIKSEYGTDNSSEFTNTLNWYLCKFQRITAVEQLRKTLGAGANALDFNRSIDSNKVNLIDLASPTIGTHAARIIGTLTLMKFWNAALTRRDRDKTHILVLDEASLFQTNPLPRILAEGRKFSVSCVMCHQHTAQMTPEIREALEANSANFSAFRLSTKDAANAAIRFDDPGIMSSLTRLNAFNAVTTLSVDGQQTTPFTLETIKPKLQKKAEEMAKQIEKESIEKLVKPYEDYRALSQRDIQWLLDKGQRLSNEPFSTRASEEENEKTMLRGQNRHTKSRTKRVFLTDDDSDNTIPSKTSSFLDDWNKYRKNHPIAS